MAWLDLTPESVECVKLRLTMRHLSFEAIKQGSALDIPFDDKSFNVVYSDGACITFRISHGHRLRFIGF